MSESDIRDFQNIRLQGPESYAPSVTPALPETDDPRFDTVPGALTAISALDGGLDRLQQRAAARSQMAFAGAIAAIVVLAGSALVGGASFLAGLAAAGVILLLGLPLAILVGRMKGGVSRLAKTCALASLGDLIEGWVVSNDRAINPRDRIVYGYEAQGRAYKLSATQASGDGLTILKAGDRVLLSVHPSRPSVAIPLVGANIENVLDEARAAVASERWESLKSGRGLPRLLAHIRSVREENAKLG